MGYQCQSEAIRDPLLAEWFHEEHFRLIKKHWLFKKLFRKKVLWVTRNHCDHPPYSLMKTACFQCPVWFSPNRSSKSQICS